MTPITIRQRLQDLEFSEEQEITLTLELINRIEKDIDGLQGKNSRAGFSSYLAIAGLATVCYVLFGELAKVTAFQTAKVGISFLAGILLLKIPWAIYQLMALDQAKKKSHAPGRFFWSNDFFFEHRLSGSFQAFIFIGSLAVTFFLPIPAWVKAFTAISFLLYLFIIGSLIFFSLRTDAYTSNNTNPAFIIWTPILFIVFTAIAVVGLVRHVDAPIGVGTGPYLFAGLILAIVFFLDLTIRLSTPSLLLEKLQRLRYDIIFLNANLTDAWTRYEVYVDGHDISEALRVQMGDIMGEFDTIEFHLSQMEDAVAKIKVRLSEIQQGLAKDFDLVDKQNVRLYIHKKAHGKVYESLNPQLEVLAKEIQKISRTTQEWERADVYHQVIMSRFTTISDREISFQNDAKEANGLLAILRPAPDENNKA